MKTATASSYLFSLKIRMIAMAVLILSGTILTGHFLGQKVAAKLVTIESVQQAPLVTVEKPLVEIEKTKIDD
jgi:hypothetical protein